MFTVINGLPAHVLLIHVVIVFVPLAALLLVLSAVWPAARRRLGVLTPLTAAVALVFVPITTSAGHWLRDHLPPQVAQSAAVRKHTDMGDNLLPWVIGLFVVAAGLWLLARRADLVWRPVPAPPAPADDADAAAGGSGGGTATATAVRPRTAPTRLVLPVRVTAAIAAVAIAVSVGSVVQLYLIGDAGAHAVWNGTVSP